MRLPDGDRSRAVLIGASKFFDPDLPDLPAVKNNLNDLAALLHERTGIPHSHCIVLCDPTDADQVGDLLERITKLAQDMLLVYYAGHGLLDVKNNELHLAIPSTRRRRVRLNSVPYDYIRDVVFNSPADNRIVILDCCFSGRAIKEAMTDTASMVSSQIEIAGTYTLTSTSANTPAYAPKDARWTAFTGELLRLLKDGVPNTSELLALDALYPYLVRALTSRGFPRPEQCGTRTAGLLALTRNVAQIKEIPVGKFPGDSPHNTAPSLPVPGRQAKTPRWLVTAAIILVTGALVAAVFNSTNKSDSSIQCASGTLEIKGSPTFLPIVDRIARKYESSCHGATITLDFFGSIAGVRYLEAQKSKDLAVFSDGVIPDVGLRRQPVAIIIYSIVVNTKAGVDQFSLDQIRDIYIGRLTNWREVQVGGQDLAIKIVSEGTTDSGTRFTFQKKVLGFGELGPSSNDCNQRDRDPRSPIISCERTTTDEVLDVAKTTPGAIGFSLTPIARNLAIQRGVTVARINGVDPDINSINRDSRGVDQGYPFWTIEYVYTEGLPSNGSLLESFLRYLYSDSGGAEISKASYIPCTYRSDLC